MRFFIAKQKPEGYCLRVFLAEKERFELSNGL